MKTNKQTWPRTEEQVWLEKIENAKDWLASCGLFTQDRYPKNIRNVSGEKHVSWNLYTNPSNPVQFFNAIK